MQRFRVHTPSFQCLEDVTVQVDEAVRRSGVQEGVCHLFVPHTTAGLIVNENADPGLWRDFIEKLEALLPHDAPYHHNEPNGHAHLKSSLVGHSATLPVSGGRLALGRWQAVFVAEFDGPREREVWLTLTAAAPAESAQRAERATS
ncbi:MAG: secondary thiamine-phosphate synthase enzyme YjbQ [Dehalococcoidia bacterium]